MQERRPTIALAGASGYVGGRLLERLEAAGFPVRCLARRPEYLAGRVASTTTVVRGDCLEAQTLEPLLRDVDCAFYLVHSMGSNGDFARQDGEAALNFARVARKAGVRRIVYLGGLGDASEELSRHLKSRHETGEALRSEGVPVIEFRVDVEDGSTVIHQTAVFDPVGLAGLVYWYGIYPAHRRVFAGMLCGIASCPSSNLNPSRTPVRTESLNGATSASGSTNE